LCGESAEIVARERARIAVEGWRAQLLDRQRPDGRGGDGVAAPLWQSTLCTLVLLKDMRGEVEPCINGRDGVGLECGKSLRTVSSILDGTYVSRVRRGPEFPH
jgi:hypothetical protein